MFDPRRIGRNRQRLLTYARVPETGKGTRIYAIGDIHGQIDLFRNLLSQIEADDAARGKARTQLILLGDFIDRGKGSAELLRRLATLRSARRLIVLKGNHEASMVDALRGDLDAMRLWLTFGGTATLAGFGVDPEDIDPLEPERMISLARKAVPNHLVSWLAGLPLHHRNGSYYFVHAGVRPGVPLNRQRASDLLWIRGDFIASPGDHGAIVVHGHTIEERGPVLGTNRIGIDTGAYRTGRLVALGLEDRERWLLEASSSRKDRRGKPLRDASDVGRNPATAA
jgi:serine/threonine protein phosphatase 1